MLQQLFLCCISEVNMKTRKKVTEVVNVAAPHMVGDGFRVNSVFHSTKKLSPFFLMDYAAPAYFPPTNKPRGVDQHPHRGFETVTVVYQGELEHRDSNGGHGKIGPGDVQWMTAASGVVHEEKHSEAFSKKGGKVEMAQIWVNLPKAFKMSAPGYQTLLNDQIPVINISEESYIRIIAGQYGQQAGAAKTFSPLNLWDIQLKAGHETTISIPEGHNTGIAVLKGEASFNDVETAKGIQLVVFDPAGEEIVIKATTDTNLLLLSGEPINEPVFAYGPFVMNSQEEIAEAIEDYNNGKMGFL